MKKCLIFTMLLSACTQLVQIQADSDLILNALSTFDIPKLELALKNHGIVKKTLKKELLRVSDELISLESKNTAWSKRYDALFQILLGTPLILLSTRLLINMPKKYESSLWKNIWHYFTGQSQIQASDTLNAGTRHQNTNGTANRSTPISSPTPQKASKKLQENSVAHQVLALQPNHLPTHMQSPVEQNSQSQWTVPKEAPKVNNNQAKTNLHTSSIPNTLIIASSGISFGVGAMLLFNGFKKLKTCNQRYIKALAMKHIIQSLPDTKDLDFDEDISLA